MWPAFVTQGRCQSRWAVNQTRFYSIWVVAWDAAAGHPARFHSPEGAIQLAQNGMISISAAGRHPGTPCTMPDHTIASPARSRTGKSRPLIRDAPHTVRTRPVSVSRVHFARPATSAQSSFSCGKSKIDNDSSRSAPMFCSGSQKYFRSRPAAYQIQNNHPALMMSDVTAEFAAAFPTTESQFKTTLPRSCWQTRHPAKSRP